MANHYDDVLIKIEKFVDDKEYDKALELILEELKMPYIPKEYDDKINEIYDNILYAKKEEIGYQGKIYSQEDIKYILNNENDLNILMDVFEQLKDLNIRKFENDISLFLENKSKNNIAKTFLLEMLANQDISSTFKVLKGDKIFNIVPSNQERILESNMYALVTKKIEDILQKQPSIIEIAHQIFDLFIYEVFPEMPPIDDSYELAIAVSNKALKMLGAKGDNIFNFKYNIEKLNAYEKLLEIV